MQNVSSEHFFKSNYRDLLAYFPGERSKSLKQLMGKKRMLLKGRRERQRETERDRERDRDTERERESSLVLKVH